MTESGEPAGSDAEAVAPRTLQNHTLDSTRWSDFVFRDGDIVTVTWAKTGTTWVQQILGQLIFSGAPDLSVVEISPWIEHRCFSKRHMYEMLAAQTHRRFVKTHLPADALPMSPRAKYLYIGRDGRDALWSWHNHHCSLAPHVYRLVNDTPGRVGPPLEPPRSDIREYFHEWLDRDGYPLWPFWSHVRSWWEQREQPNVLFVHFNKLKEDMPQEIRRIARFLDIAVDESLWPTILAHCSFEYVKANAARLSRVLEKSFVGGASSFIYKGTNGRWRDVLSEADLRKYDAACRANLGAECSRWLATGTLPSE